MTEINPNDQVDTPYPVAYTCVSTLIPLIYSRRAQMKTRLNEPVKLLDVGAGSGVWGQAAKDFANNRGYRRLVVHGVERDPKFSPHPAYNEWIVDDFLNTTLSGYDLVYGNPPFSLAEACAWTALYRIGERRALVRSEGYVGMLLRLGFLGSYRRQELFTDYPLQAVHVLVPRVSFRSSGATDYSEYALFQWSSHTRQGSGMANLDWIVWR